MARMVSVAGPTAETLLRGDNLVTIASGGLLESRYIQIE
jgi:hypothetical protein